MSDIITITGIVATDPRHIVTQAGLDVASFRVASAQGHYDSDAGKWVETGTNWYSISAFRQLAVGVTSSLRRGEHVIVTGKLRVRTWEDGDKSGTNVEIDADAIGHDLTWGTTVYTRTPRTGDTAEQGAPDEPSAGTGPF
ncbi:single-stranded DNA-binding protein [Herbiconiux daphne]|uniref:Single-stranded DNA-binding protein n=1 Tax=Herbiconiux daphne TaxID=2970914 RepID=A0ABT2H713_9MICO|nr:single-stranded DNA-binding protein [Herbiconiux daphne]MCS5735668.1 single-stranded DNA-binding protein [Herbiconiux daphne]